MPRPLKLFLQIAVAVAVSASVSVIAISLIFSKTFIENMTFFTPPFEVATADAAQRLMAPVMPAVDPSIDPQAAAIQYRAFLPIWNPDGRGATHPAVRTVPILPFAWTQLAEDRTLFPDARTANRIDRGKLIATLGRRLTPEERATLANVAEDSLWRDFDRLARAARIDVAAGSFTFPLDPAHSAFELPIPRLNRLNELADGVALRALHFATTGRRDSSEAAFGALYAIGLRTQEGALSLIEALLGQRLALEGIELRRALHAAAPRAGSDAIVASAVSIRQANDSARQARRTRSVVRDSSAERPDARAYMLDRAGDSTASRALRVELLGLIGYTSCGSLKELFFGPSERLRAIRDDALATLAYSAADSAYFRYLEAQTTEATVGSYGGTWFDRIVRGTGGALSTVTTNPRFRACTDAVAAAQSY